MRVYKFQLKPNGKQEEILNKRDILLHTNEIYSPGYIIYSKTNEAAIMQWTWATLQDDCELND